MVRRVLFIVAVLAASVGLTGAPAGAYWVCVGVTPLDLAVCQDDPFPGPPPLPDAAPHLPSPAVTTGS